MNLNVSQLKNRIFTEVGDLSDLHSLIMINIKKNGRKIKYNLTLQEKKDKLIKDIIEDHIEHFGNKISKRINYFIEYNTYKDFTYKQLQKMYDTENYDIINERQSLSFNYNHIN